MPFGGMLTLGAIGAGTSLLGGLFGSNAAEQAAQQQAQQIQQGLNVASTNTQSAINAIGGGTTYNQQLYQPYLMAGAGGLGTLSSMMNAGPGGLLQPYGQTFQAPTAAQAQQTPGYQFTLDQGLGAIQNSAAAKGDLLSTGTMKNMANYAGGLASTTYQQTYNNALQQYQQNYGQFLTNQQNQYNRLMGLTGIGTGATTNMGNIAMGGAGTAASIYGNNTAAMASLLGQKGQALASGTVGSANAWQGALGNIGGMANTVGLLGMMQGGFGGGGGGNDPTSGVLAGLGGDFGNWNVGNIGTDIGAGVNPVQVQW